MAEEVPHFTHPTSDWQAEAIFTDFGLTEALIQKVLEVVDKEDALLDADAYDPTHKGVSRWGHALANLRLGLRSHDWSWETINPKLRSVLSPGREIQICVAASKWVAGRPQTLPRGWHTIEAVTGNQLWLPLIERGQGEPVPGTITWVMCFERRIKKATADDDGPAVVEYQYELSLPMTVFGTGDRKRIVDWRLRCFRGEISFERQIEPLSEEEEFDFGTTEGLDGIVGRK